MDFSDEEDEDWFGSRFNDGVNEEEEEGFVFYDDVGENEEEEGFASDFYKAGSDWSCLVEDEETVCSSEKNKKMKQANLFQIWGLQENSPDTTKKMKQTDLFQSWGLQKPSPFTSPASNSSKKTTSTLGKRRRDSSFGNDSPRPCPFYKKLPGLSLFFIAFIYINVLLSLPIS